MLPDGFLERLIAVVLAATGMVAEVNEPATVNEGAVRGEQVQVTEPPPPPQSTGLYGLPFAPEHLTGCDEFDFYRVQVGLPDRFRGIAWRESNCRNEPEVRTFCCHGYLQLYVSLHLRDHRIGPRYAECGITGISDIDQDTPLSKQKQLCGAKALYDIVGISAWSATA